eukprot:TRINITY_DN4117_c1_g1_i1.p1 TRINITY_DN4117_c1_g1~~TRINITY_DN4117_c1_g1_i1.p1  ORF type:complete len:140 (+),score=37.34 TRINITY_DN4117_c1_g1_i1:50-469(+)
MRDSRSCSRASTSSGSISPELGGSQSEIREFYPARKPYRMASNFELGYEQPQVYKERAQKLSASSYSNLFGVPPARSRPLSKKVIQPVKIQTRNRKQKPLPVNPLTGATIGLPHKLVSTSFPAQANNKRSPGGPHNQLW